MDELDRRCGVIYQATRRTITSALQTAIAADATRLEQRLRALGALRSSSAP
jgi:hypothetical protein